MSIPLFVDGETELDATTLNRLVNAGAGTYNVLHYEAAADGVTDDTAAFAAAIADMPATGGVLHVPVGDYVVGDLVITKPIRIQGGMGLGQNTLVGTRGTRIIVPSGSVGITFGDVSTTRFNGPEVRDLVFVGDSGALGGLLILRANNWYLERVIATEFTTGYGIKSDGTGNVNQYGTLVECAAHNCDIGYHAIESNGITLLGGHFDGNSNGSGSPASAPPGTGSVGIHQQSGDTLRLFGTRVQFYDTGILLDAGIWHELHGVRIEATTVAIQNEAENTAIFGGSISNNISGSGGTGVLITGDATDTLVLMPKIESVATPISDLGALTVRLHDRTMYFPNGGSVRIGDTTIGEGSSGSVSIINNLSVQSNITLDTQDDGDKLLFGSALDTNLYRSAANTLKTDDKLITTVGLGVGNSAAATTLGSVTDKIEVFDGSGVSLGFLPVYDSIS